MPTTPLERAIFAQGGQCFFCSRTLPKDEASVDHLVPTSQKGGNGDENLVACCKTLNGIFGQMTLKEKLRVILNQRGKFVCPNLPKTNAPAAPQEGRHLPPPKK
ncbi:MAG: HNH endonuclease [Chthoniobacter sp.]|nr:HNH endonuclease [Chthoniobacter sp.]